MPKFKAWAKNSTYYPGDNEETILLKRIYWISIHFVILLLSYTTMLVLIQGIIRWALIGPIYVGFYLLNLVIFYKVRRGIEWFGLSTQIFHMLFSFVMVLICGGILYSGGVVFIGL